MPREERRGEGGAPERARGQQPAEQEEGQNGVEGVPQDARDVVTRGREPVELAIEHVR